MIILIQTKMSNYQSEQESQFQLKEANYKSKICIKSPKKVCQRTSLWSLKQNKKYVNFIQRKKYVFQNSQLRKQSKIFVQMSRFIKTRNSVQCRTHHQKFEKVHKNIESIIEYFAQKTKSLESQASYDSKISLTGITITDQPYQLDGTSKNNTGNPSCFEIIEITEQKHEELWEIIDSSTWLNSANLQTKGRH